MSFVKKIIIVSLLMFVFGSANSKEFQMGTPKYLMDGCEDALAYKSSFKAGYCFGVYSSVLSVGFSGFKVRGTKYCPNTLVDVETAMALVVNYIKSHPKVWRTGDDDYMFELALTEAYPCTSN